LPVSRTFSLNSIKKDSATLWPTRRVMQQAGLSAVILSSRTVLHSRVGGSSYSLRLTSLTLFRGRKVMSAFPGVEVSTKHDYEIAYKFSWRCLAPSCGHMQVSISVVGQSLTVPQIPTTFQLHRLRQTRLLLRITASATVPKSSKENGHEAGHFFCCPW
jgi:hypothetical protein